MAVAITDLGAAVEDGAQQPLREQLLDGLADTQGELKYGGTPFAHRRSFPTVLLYDDRGLSIYDQITRVKEYYLYAAEHDILQKHGLEIVRAMFDCKTSQDGLAVVDVEKTVHTNGAPKSQLDIDERWGSHASGRHNYGVNGQHEAGPEAIVIELGAGSLGKVKWILRALSQILKSPDKAPLSAATYFAVDLEEPQLVSTLNALAKAEPDSVSAEPHQPGLVQIQGLRSSYEEAFPALRSGDLLGRPSKANGANGDGPSRSVKRSLLWLGSSLGNFDRAGSKDFLRRLSDEAMDVGDTLLIGIDGCEDGAKIELAYHDPAGVTESFILNGLEHADRLLGGQGLLRPDRFEYISRFNTDIGAHEAFVRAKERVVLPASVTGRGEDIVLEAGEVFAIEQSFKFDATESHELFDHARLRLVQTWSDPATGYQLHLLEKPAFFFPRVGAKSGLPTLEDWDALWKAFDSITREVIPEWMQHVAPIDLRHICLFYSGHIPTFVDIHLSRALKEPYTEPASYTQIFERGIDPNVDDPTIIHAHSEVPKTAEEWPTLAEIDTYRDMVRQRLRNTYERLPEIGKTSRRLARTLAMVYEHEAMHLETLCYMLVQKSTEINRPSGFSTPDWTALAREWDAKVAREGSARGAVVSVAAGSVTLGQTDADTADATTPFDPTASFGWDNEHGERTVEVPAHRISLLPISNGQYAAFLSTQKQRAELVPASWALIEGSDASYGVRVLPAPGVVPMAVAQHWPVIASPQQLSAFARSKGGRLPTEPELHRFWQEQGPDVAGANANTGLVRWHPIPPSLPYVRRDGSKVGGGNGGVWEATSTTFEAHEGFSSSELYPGYSSDFFDGLHCVVLGGSYLTIPRLTRSTFRNWYQSAYKFAFLGGRVIYDI